MLAAVEDALSEAIVRRTVAAIRPDLVIWQVIRKNGSGYLKSRARELNRTAHQVPVLLLADQDTPGPCPAGLIASWLGVPPAPNLLFRVAVMEIESWIMADRRGFSAFMGIPQDAIPDDPDGILKPKEFIVSLARKSKRKDIREDLVPVRGSTAIVGPAFNARLTEFVGEEWNPAKAAKSSDSFGRAVRRLEVAFRQRFS